MLLYYFPVPANIATTTQWSNIFFPKKKQWRRGMDSMCLIALVQPRNSDKPASPLRLNMVNSFQI
jgi:hypothetical protein